MSVYQNALDLPQPSSWSMMGDQRIRHSARQSAGMFLTSQADDQIIRRVYGLQYTTVRAEVAQAVWNHYELYCLGQFYWIPPKATESIAVRWLTPPQIVYESPIAASVTCELERVQLVQ